MRLQNLLKIKWIDFLVCLGLHYTETLVQSEFQFRVDLRYAILAYIAVEL